MKFIRSATLLFLVPVFVSAQKPEASITLDAGAQEFQISKNIYGQFAEHLGHLIYGGIWVGPESDIPNIHGLRKDVVDALRDLKVPVLRWPGGCFADEYHWMNGIGPRASRPKMINTNWGGVTEDNSFGTHEFLELCELVGCEPYITGNLGSGTVQELSQWVEYVNSDNISPMTDLRKKNGREKPWGVKYWGVGNESWGCGGNMLPEYYVSEARKFATFMRTYGSNRLFRIACGPNSDDYAWTQTVMKQAGSAIDGLSLHYYTWSSNKTATEVDKAGWFDVMKKALKMEELITRHSGIMDTYDPLKRTALVVDEWGTWFKVEPGTNPGFLYQQNTMRDAVVAGLNLNIFNNHCDRVRMANIAQVVNVLQAMMLTDGKKMTVTPTYHVFSMYKVHQNAMMIPVTVASRMYVYGGDTLRAVNCSASMDSAGLVHISLCNIDPGAPVNVTMRLSHFTMSSTTGEVLTADSMNAHNTFEHPDVVKPARFTSFKPSGNDLSVTLPPMSVVVLTVKGEVRMDPKAAITLTKPAQGLQYHYYETTGESMPAFSTLTPATSGTIESIALPKGVRDSDFGLLYDGYIKIPERGLYTFFASSDDGSALAVDGKIVVNNDGRHATIERSGLVQLDAGYHRLQVMYFQAGGGMELSASIQGPHMPKQTIPATMLYREQ